MSNAFLYFRLKEQKTNHPVPLSSHLWEKKSLMSTRLTNCLDILCLLTGCDRLPLSWLYPRIISLPGLQVTWTISVWSDVTGTHCGSPRLTNHFDNLWADVTGTHCGSPRLTNRFDQLWSDQMWQWPIMLLRLRSHLDVWSDVTGPILSLPGLQVAWTISVLSDVTGTHFVSPRLASHLNNLWSDVTGGPLCLPGLQITLTISVSDQMWWGPIMSRPGLQVAWTDRCDLDSPRLLCPWSGAWFTKHSCELRARSVHLNYCSMVDKQ
jgi:hypothetical protein